MVLHFRNLLATAVRPAAAAVVVVGSALLPVVVQGRYRHYSCNSDCTDTQLKEFWGDCCTLDCNDGQRDYDDELPHFVCTSYTNAWMYYVLVGIPCMVVVYWNIVHWFRGGAFVVPNHEEKLSKGEGTSIDEGFNTTMNTCTTASSNEGDHPMRVKDYTQMLARVKSLDMNIHSTTYSADIEYFTHPGGWNNPQRRTVPLTPKGYEYLSRFVSYQEIEMEERDDKTFQGFVLIFVSGDPSSNNDDHGSLYLYREWFYRRPLVHLIWCVPLGFLCTINLVMNTYKEDLVALLVMNLLLLYGTFCVEDPPADTTGNPLDIISTSNINAGVAARELNSYNRMT